jgi:protein CpxP
MKWIPGSFSKRALMVGLIAGSGVMAASSFAMSGGPAGKGDCQARHGQKNQAERMEQRTRHMSELKAKLKLRPDQEVAWSTFVGDRQAEARPMGVDREAMRNEFAKLNTPQRIDKMQAMSDMRHAKMVERAQATKTFYAQLTPEQQSVFDAQARFGFGGHGHHQS